MNYFEIVQQALKEDIQYGDITTENLNLGDHKSKAHLLARQDGVIAGIKVFCEAFHQIDQNTKIQLFVQDGEFVSKGTKFAEIEGRAASILKAERVGLNFLQRLSGIATLTRSMADKLKGYNTRLLDTRKTTPLLRELEKKAVVAGGGFNHRFGLFDMMMLKENHIAAAGSISEAVKRVRARDVSHKLEVEVRNMQELAEAVACNVDRVMLDNMTCMQMKEAVNLYSGKVELEASGNISLETIENVAATGVDFISSGALTHSYKSMDISLIFEEVK